MFGLPNKLMLYGVVILAVAAALAGVRFSIIQSAIRKYEAKLNTQRLKSLRRAKEIRDEVKTLDDDELLDGITRGG